MFVFERLTGRYNGTAINLNLFAINAYAKIIFQYL